MTVTLTIEELRDYQVSMQNWAHNNALLEAVKSQDWSRFIDSPYSGNPMDGIKRSIEDWMTKNPMPKLVPKELEA